MRQFVGALLFIVLATCFPTAQSRPDSLARFLQEYVKAPDEETKTTEYCAALADLRDDGTKEAIVYLSSDGWCGTAGCTMLILAPEGTSYKVVSQTSRRAASGLGPPHKDKWMARHWRCRAKKRE